MKQHRFWAWGAVIITMTMQITAPQAQKRCCFIPISSCPETNSFLRILRYYSSCLLYTSDAADD